MASSAEQKQILKLIFARQVVGRPYVAPPGVPKDRLDALRKAFMDTMVDKDFLADASKAKLEISAVPGDQVEALVNEIYGFPPEVARKAGALIK